MEREVDYEQIRAENDARFRAETREAIAAGERVHPWSVRFVLRENPMDPELIALRREQKRHAYEFELLNIIQKLDGTGLTQRKREVLVRREAQLGRLIDRPIALHIRS